ncbi:hypothetical protein [Kitasatospora sp. HPMI-4]|uniref:hypothetical protein n=1 Tax=Kitasatospora sp. HPMI-4 TaxID=3448443 RepID=UPI003F1B7377
MLDQTTDHRERGGELSQRYVRTALDGVDLRLLTSCQTRFGGTWSKKAQALFPALFPSCR